MTKQECDNILSDKNNPMYSELRHKYYKNYNICRKYYDSLGYKGYTLHHKNVGCDNYEEWKIEEIEPMTRAEHSRLHMVFYKQGLGSEESIKKSHLALAEKYKNGEIAVWNKGLTSDIDSRVASPRKGKTGEDYPFLCASKKGKSGGWNKGLTKETDERVAKYSNARVGKGSPKIIGENNPSKRPDVKQKIIESKLGKKKYSNGIETRLFIPGDEPDGFLPTYFFSKKYKRKNKQ